MKRRRVLDCEQPHALHYGLQQAVVVTGELMPDRSGITRDAVPVGDFGLPHGAKDALVLVRNLRVEFRDGHPVLLFCRTYGYQVLEKTLWGADDTPYPPLCCTRLSTSGKVPPTGSYDALLRVSVNGYVDVHVEKFGVHPAAITTQAMAMEAVPA